MAKGIIVAIEGIDQSGKGTQCDKLIDRLRKNGNEVESISFPNYFTIIGNEIKAFLAGERDYNPHVRHMLLSLNRWEHKDIIDKWLEKGKIIVFDRYSGSNYAYGLMKGLDLDWLLNLEKGLPEPDVTILLDLLPSVSLDRKVSGRDIHEKDQKFLNKVRKEYLELSKKWNWNIVNGNQDINIVHDNIWLIVNDFIEKYSC